MDGDCSTRLSTDHSTRRVSTRSFVSLPRAPPFYLPYTVPLVTVLSHYSTAGWHSLIAPFFVWVVVPLLDFIVDACPTSPHRLTKLQRKKLESEVAFKMAVLFWCPIQITMLVWAAYRVQQTNNPVVGTRLVGLVWSISLIAAEGINCSHELLHRRTRLERLLGKALLVSVLYGHFNIEHTRGHHTRVATPEDPATLQYGESFYHFLPRTVIGGYKSAWRLELARLRRHNYARISYHNELIISGLLQLGLCFTFYTVFGTRGLFLFLCQAISAIILLEQINAIEHYGLSRKPIASDSSKRYQVLELTEGSPQLPVGYLSLAPLLLVPPVWRYVMDGVLQKYWNIWKQEDEVTGQ